MLQNICSGYVTQVSEPWPVGLLFGKDLLALLAICSFCGCFIVFSVFPFGVGGLMWIWLYEFLSSLIYFPFNSNSRYFRQLFL